MRCCRSSSPKANAATRENVGNLLVWRAIWVPYNALSRSVPGIIAYCSARFSAGCPQDIRIYVDNLVNTGDNPATIGDNLHYVRDLLTVQHIASIVGCNIACSSTD